MALISDPISSVVDLGKDILDKIFPDKTQAEALKAQLVLAEQQGQLDEIKMEFDLAKAQIGVNAVEAASTSLFVAGWRPFIGWICGFALVWQYILAPMIAFACAIFNHPVPLPTLDSSALMSLLLTMLGMGAMRSFDKKNSSNAVTAQKG